MPLHDFNCSSCGNTFEELHKHNETVYCFCGAVATMIVCKLADYTGQASKTVQYATRNSPYKDSHIQKLSDDKSFLRNSIPTQIVRN